MVFSDITGIKALHEAEERLNRELREAYLKLEESNRNLSRAGRKAHLVRLAATLLVFLLFAGTGLYYWGRGSVQGAGAPTMGRNTEENPVNRPTVPVTLAPISSTISLSGKIEPLELVNVVSPFQGVVLEKHFEFGQEVEAGALLLLLDTRELEIKLRDAKAAVIKAEQKLEELEGWEKGNEVSRAKRSLVKAMSNLDRAQRKLAETEVLYRKEIVPANEYEGAKTELQNAEGEVKSAKEEFASTREKGNARNLDIARMELENARVKMKEIEGKIRLKEVRAPVSGVVLRGASGDSGSGQGKEKELTFEPGTPVQESNILMAVGNLAGRSVRTQVDEVDLRKIRTGLDAICSGEGFPGVRVNGKIRHISSQASASGGSGATGGQGPVNFEVLVTLPSIDPECQHKIRVGMSANLEIIIYENPRAILVPIDAVADRGDKRMVEVLDPATGAFREVEVKTGITTLTSVEITSGLNEGDRVAPIRN